MKVTISSPSIQIDPGAVSRSEFSTLAQKEVLNTSLRLRGAIAQGRGADNQEIKPDGYSESYRKSIRAGMVTGHTGVRKTSESVNLTISGDLLNSIQVKAIDGGAQAYFLGNHHGGTSNAELASYLFNRGFKSWFEFGRVDIARIEQSVSKFVDDSVKNLVRVNRG